MSVLHVAPEACLEPRLRSLIGRGYVTADVRPGRADLTMDVMNIQSPDETYDRIICSHVLEHVDDDRQAMREFRRVLKTDGEAYLLVPITNGERTYEDPAITDPRDRERAFGQRDHVRKYGRDYLERLRACEFDVEVLRVSDLAGPEDAERMGLAPVSAGEIYVCRRGTTPGPA
jgi:SAM-dependent methyltransferase